MGVLRTESWGQVELSPEPGRAFCSHVRGVTLVGSLSIVKNHLLESYRRPKPVHFSAIIVLIPTPLHAGGRCSCHKGGGVSHTDVQDSIAPSLMVLDALKSGRGLRDGKATSTRR